jgi:hypothetical protein
MAYYFQVTIDSAAPHPLADWWAEALGWQREPTDEAFIRRMVDEGHASESDTMRHNGELVWAEGAAIRHPAGDAPRMLFQLVPEPKTVKNRVHWDVRGELAELLDAGARLVRARDEEISWSVLADPEGNEFCVFDPHGS